MTTYDPNHVPQKSFFLLGVKVLIINEQDEALLLWRSDKVSRPHGIDVPGGGVDAGESPDDAAIREVFEETGISIGVPQLKGTYYTKSGEDDAVIMVYVVHIKGEISSVTLSWEHEAYEWKPIDSVDITQLPPIHAKLFQSIR